MIPCSKVDHPKSLKETYTLSAFPWYKNIEAVGHAGKFSSMKAFSSSVPYIHHQEPIWCQFWKKELLLLWWLYWRSMHGQVQIKFFNIWAEELVTLGKEQLDELLKCFYLLLPVLTILNLSVSCFRAIGLEWGACRFWNKVQTFLYSVKFSLFRIKMIIQKEQLR